MSAATWVSWQRMRWSKFGRARGWHRSRKWRARRAREAAQGAPLIVWDMRKPCRGLNSNVCVAEGCYAESCLRINQEEKPC